MSIYQQLIHKETKLSVIGLGYVGMPIAIAFANHVDTIGFDINSQKINLYQQGIDPTFEVGDHIIQDTTVSFTSDPTLLQQARFHIVAVPTPINQDKTPDLSPITGATRTLATHLKPGSIIVYESTVYPGVTEDICIPLLEEISGLKHGQDFVVGYSPERINPGDKIHTIETITKIVSASTPESLEDIANVYEMIVKAGVHRAPSIKVAEAAKVVENSQRDINIAFMNELALAFDKMNIDSQDVLDAMNTKWNALGFKPGLVGGHCIGVDPYYFVYEAENLGYHSQIISNGRQINDSMGAFIADKTIEKLILTGKKPIEANVVILGMTFKEHTPDTRNSKVIDIINRLKAFNICPIIVDPWADIDETRRYYNLELTQLENISQADAVIFSVAHQDFLKLSIEQIEGLFKPSLPPSQRIIIDVKSILNKDIFTKLGYTFWRL